MAGFCLMALLVLVTTGCPTGQEYPLGDDSTNIDPALLGTWVARSDSAEMLEINVTKEDEVTYGIEVVSTSDSYLLDDVEFFAWITRIDGHQFLFAQPLSEEDDKFYVYHYTVEKNQLVIHDVGLLVGGSDAVTSMEAFREEVSASLKLPDCLTGRVDYVKK